MQVRDAGSRMEDRSRAVHALVPPGGTGGEAAPVVNVFNPVTDPRKQKGFFTFQATVPKEWMNAKATETCTFLKNGEVVYLEDLRNRSRNDNGGL